MTLVVLPVHPPAVLSGQSNGKLAASILVSMPGLAGGPTVRLVETAARCWTAMTAAATTAGVTLQATGLADSYRTYERQVATFTARYQTDPTGNGWKLWDSDNSGTPERWYKKDGVATAAVPGTSNHGWGLAVDVANAFGARLRWLEANAVRYGWSWETVPEEPWHIRNVTGDAIPPAVLAYEEDRMSLDEWTANPAGHPTWALTQGTGGYAGQQRDTALAFAWQEAHDAREAAQEALATATATKGVVDQILAILQAGVPVPGEVTLSAASVAEIRDAVADLGEGGAAQVRADAD